jgi:transcriptional regulator with XRE-family HTH domain
VPDDVGERIRAARKGRRWSQDRLAKRADLSRATISRIESGDHHVAEADTLFRIAHALDVPIGDFVPAWPEWEPIKGQGLGPAIRERRRALNMTLARLAELAGVSEATLSRFERGAIENSGLVRKIGDEHVLDNDALAEFLDATSSGREA